MYSVVFVMYSVCIRYVFVLYSGQKSFVLVKKRRIAIYFIILHLVVSRRRFLRWLLGYQGPVPLEKLKNPVRKQKRLQRGPNFQVYDGQSGAGLVPLLSTPGALPLGKVRSPDRKFLLFLWSPENPQKNSYQNMAFFPLEKLKKPVRKQKGLQRGPKFQVYDGQSGPS